MPFEPPRLVWAETCEYGVYIFQIYKYPELSYFIQLETLTICCQNDYSYVAISLLPAVLRSSLKFC
jgi:hypothetical protein